MGPLCDGCQPDEDWRLQDFCGAFGNRLRALARILRDAFHAGGRLHAFGARLRRGARTGPSISRTERQEITCEQCKLARRFRPPAAYGDAVLMVPTRPVRTSCTARRNWPGCGSTSR